ncbi:MAG: TIGR01906 family membrane protein [archaeon]
MRSIFILALLLVLFLVLGSARITVYDRGFYSSQYAENGAYEGLGRDAAEMATDELLSYFMFQGTLTDFFNDREKLHLADVRELIRKAGVVQYSVLLAIIGYLMYISVKPHFRSTVYLAFILSFLVVITVSSGLYLFSGYFSEMFTWFHLVSFDNDYWLLNPLTDNLIVMLPQSFFYNAFFLVIKRTLIGGAALAAAGSAIKNTSSLPFLRS